MERERRSRRQPVQETGRKVPVDNTIAFVCGPPIMFRFVIKDLLDMGFQEHNIVSTLERYMKCGVGKCGHCCIGVAYVCVDGPVFTYARSRCSGRISDARLEKRRSEKQLARPTGANAARARVSDGRGQHRVW